MKNEVTIKVIDNKQCTGCSACANKCPVDAIQMVENTEGFLFPVIDESKCISCGACLNCCEVNTGRTNRTSDFTPRYWAFYQSEDVRRNSSSGGLFNALAKKILENGGMVFGARFSDDYKSVYHVGIENVDDLVLLQKSKYVQSKIGLTYREARCALESGRNVLFTGTPCQIDGLMHFLGKDYENLITMDIVCHGVPSPKVFNLYMEQLSKNRRIKKIDFRDKSIAEWGTVEYIEFEDGSTHYSDIYRSPYLKAFLEGLSTRESCGVCKYANPERIGDISAGDFWGINQISDEFKGINGVSFVITNTEKGEKIFKELISSNVVKEFSKEVAIENAKKNNGQFIWPREQHWARKRFFEDINNKEVAQAVGDSLNSIYDVGVVGWWYNKNYGGTLTYYALHQVLKKMGYSVLMINKIDDDPNFKPEVDSIPYRFAQKHYWISNVRNNKTKYELNRHCRNFISGSDQLFNPVLWQWSGPEYFLDFAAPEKNKISYACSFGQTFEDIPYLTPKIAYYLKRLTAVSARENYGVDIAKEFFNLEIKQVLDPVFLVDKSEWDKLADSYNFINETEPYFVAFTLDPSEDRKKCILHLRDKLGKKVINLIHADDFDNNCRKLNLENMKPNADIEEWLYYYKNADYVITDSFHGTCFAIIMQKQFVSIANTERGDNRFISLLETFGLRNRLVYSYDELSNSNLLEEVIDYAPVNQKIEEMKVESMKWLKDALEAKRERPVTDFDAIESKVFELERLLVDRE